MELPEYPELIIHIDGTILKKTTAKPKKHTINQFGYPFVSITRNGKQIQVLVHRLIALCYIGPKPDGDYVVDHINGDRKDHSLENLRWLTRAENTVHRLPGRLRSCVNLTLSNDADEILTFGTLKECAEHFKCAGPTIGAALKKQKLPKCMAGWSLVSYVK